MKRYIIICVFSLFSLKAFSDEKRYLVFDYPCSPTCGAENFITAHHGLDYLEKNFIALGKKNRPQDNPPKKNSAKEVACALGRFLEMLFFWDPVNLIITVTQHEVFGHGYRIRSIGDYYVKVMRYEIDAPFPFGEGGGATYYDVKRTLSPFYQMAICAAGTEGTAILAKRLKFLYLRKQMLPPSTASLYFWSAQDLTVYSLLTSENINNDGHDIECYKKTLNKTYPNSYLSASSIHKRALVNFVDPFSFYAIYAWWHYVFTGKDGSIPMFNINGIQYLPGLRTGLAPYGQEFYLENFLVRNGTPIYIYLKYGSHDKNNFLGAGLEYENICVHRGWHIGLQCDLFYQPRMLFKSGSITEDDTYYGYSQTDLHKKRFGFLGACILETGITKTGSFFLQFGYKTKGFVPGESLKNAIIARTGLGLDF